MGLALSSQLGRQLGKQALGLLRGSGLAETAGVAGEQVFADLALGLERRPGGSVRRFDVARSDGRAGASPDRRLPLRIEASSNSKGELSSEKWAIFMTASFRFAVTVMGKNDDSMTPQNVD